MHKGYKISDSDRWSESDPSKFIAWKMLATRYLYSGPPEVEKLLDYADKYKGEIDVNEVDKNQELVHIKLSEEVSNFKEILKDMILL